MEYLYVCHFSNGHIKVGRSIDPRARIAAHADRVATDLDLLAHLQERNAESSGAQHPTRMPGYRAGTNTGD